MAKQLQNLCILNWLSVKIINILFSRKTVPLMHTRPRTRTPCPTCPLLETAQSPPRWRVPHSASGARRAQEQIAAGLGHASRGGARPPRKVWGPGGESAASKRDPPAWLVVARAGTRQQGPRLPSLGRQGPLFRVSEDRLVPVFRASEDRDPVFRDPAELATRADGSDQTQNPDSEGQRGCVTVGRASNPAAEGHRKRPPNPPLCATISSTLLDAPGKRGRQCSRRPRGRRGPSKSPQTPPVHGLKAGRAPHCPRGPSGPESSGSQGHSRPSKLHTNQ